MLNSSNRKTDPTWMKTPAILVRFSACVMTMATLGMRDVPCLYQIDCRELKDDFYLRAESPFEA